MRPQTSRRAPLSLVRHGKRPRRGLPRVATGDSLAAAMLPVVPAVAAALLVVLGIPRGLPAPTELGLAHHSRRLPPPSRRRRPPLSMLMAGPKSWSQPRAVVDRATALSERTNNAL